ncbi:MAG: DUF4340 domain-containing protein [Lachnospiraceae bacterium]|nr:DUF4340 domain-containing protein [Lachnospiraceae bacterium]
MKKKKWIPMAVVIGLLILLIVLYTVLKHHNEQAAGQEEQTDSIRILDWSAEDVTSVRLMLDETEEIFVLSDGQWKLQSDKDFAVSESTLQTMLQTVTELSAVREITEPDDLAGYGLDAPVQTLTIQNEKGDTCTICWGSTNDITGDDYLYIKEKPDSVYTVSGSARSSLPETLEDCRESGDDTE